jgi:hypothetical protein
MSDKPYGTEIPEDGEADLFRSLDEINRQEELQEEVDEARKQRAAYLKETKK